VAFRPAWEYTKFVFGRASPQDHAGGAPPGPLAGLRGQGDPTSKERGGRGRKGGRCLTNPCIRPCSVLSIRHSVRQLLRTSLKRRTTYEISDMRYRLSHMNKAKQQHCSHFQRNKLANDFTGQSQRQRRVVKTTVQTTTSRMNFSRYADHI